MFCFFYGIRLQFMVSINEINKDFKNLPLQEQEQVTSIKLLFKLNHENLIWSVIHT